jgi:hypothetical protein
VRLQLHALAYNLAKLLRTLALPEEVEHCSLTTLREKLVKIGARVVRHGRYVAFQLAEVAVPRWQPNRRGAARDRPRRAGSRRIAGHKPQDAVLRDRGGWFEPSKPCLAPGRRMLGLQEPASGESRLSM